MTHQRPTQAGSDSRASGNPSASPADRWARLALHVTGAEGALVVLTRGTGLAVTGRAGAEPGGRLGAEPLLLARERSRATGWIEGDVVVVPVAAGTGGESAGVVLVFGAPVDGWPAETLALLGDVAAAIDADRQAALALEARRRAEDALQRSDARFQAIFDNRAIGICLIGADGWLIRTNLALQRMFRTGEEELRGRPFVDFVHPDHCEELLSAFWQIAAAERENFQTECRLVTETGEPLWAEVIVSIVRDRQGRPLCGMAMLEDVTQRRLAEEALHESQQQLMLSQRMEAVGRLAGGIAHDFNNMLTAIGSFAQLLSMELRPTGEVAVYLGEIQKATTRAATLTRQLLAFSRQQVLRPQRLSLNRVVWDLEGMLRRLIGENVELATDLDPSLEAVEADPGQLEQVLVNLVVNSRDAMPRGGRLTVRTRNALITEEDATSYPYPVAPGRYARVTVIDTGIGMDAETQKHIFEPFFTTKGPGKGTGLGLSTVYGIVKQSRGYVWVHSDVGQGTTTEIYLPAMPEADGPEEQPSAAGPVRGGSETILLVEDEDMIRSLAHRILTRLGYTVLLAARGDEALRLYEEHGGRIDLLLTDIVMPGMNGRSLAQRLLARAPDLRIAYMSGYTADAIEQYGEFDPSAAFLDKPFTPDSLARTVREVLDRV